MIIGPSVALRSVLSDSIISNSPSYNCFRGLLQTYCSAIDRRFNYYLTVSQCTVFLSSYGRPVE